MIATESKTGKTKKRGKRSGDGGTYLVVADETEEFPLALRYAARLADGNRGRVAILHVMLIEDFHHWSDIEERMRQELRDEAEKKIWAVAHEVNELNDMVPTLYIEEGDRFDTLVDVINKDEDVRMLVLAGVSSGAGPGPLVAHFSGKGLARLRVPVVIIPSHLEPQKIDSLT